MQIDGLTIRYVGFWSGLRIQLGIAHVRYDSYDGRQGLLAWVRARTPDPAAERIVFGGHSAGERVVDHERGRRLTVGEPAAGYQTHSHRLEITGGYVAVNGSGS